MILGEGRKGGGAYGYQDGQGALGHFRLHAAVVDEEEEAPAGAEISIVRSSANSMPPSKAPYSSPHTAQQSSRGLPPRTDAHLLDLQGRYHHALDDVGEEGGHVVIAHGHVGDNLLERNLLAGKVLVLLVAVELGTQLCHFALEGGELGQHRHQHGTGTERTARQQD